MGMNIKDSRTKGSTLVLEKRAATVIASSKEQLVADAQEEQLIINTPVCTEVVSLGEGQYLRGEKGETGEEPEHEWQDTSLRFRRPDGSWGWLVDLKGDTGGKGDQGIPGPTGVGIPGPAGNPGPTQYVWAKYAATTNPAPDAMFNNPEGLDYVGLAYNRDVPEGTGDSAEFDYTQYSWSKIRGADGIPGTPGNTGEQGPAGTGFNWIGEFPQHPTEEDLGRPLKDGDTYLNTTDQKVYTYAGGWHRMLESGGAGPIGPQGAPGGGFQYQGEFETSPPGALVNWLYRNINNDLFYLYEGGSWVVATSDGKDSPDGVECGNGLRFFTSYHDSETQPNRPTLDGDTVGWNPNPHSFQPGTIKWVSQKIATEPELGTWNDALDITSLGFRGPVGFRGSQSIMIPIPGWTGTWDDNIAAQACTGGAPQEWDVVTMYKSEDPAIQETRRWALNPQNNVWEWLEYNYVFLGDVLVDGTLDAQKINVNSTMTVGSGDNVGIVSGEDTIRFAAGNANKADAPYQVLQDGKLIATNADIQGHITAETLTFITDDSIPDSINNSNSDPKGSAAAAEQAAKEYAEAQANLAEVTANAYADGIVSEEEARAIADAQAKADAAEAASNQYTDSRTNAIAADLVVAENKADQAIVDAANAQATADGAVTTYYQDSEPSNGNEGDLWVDTSEGNKQYMFASGQWRNIQDTDIVAAQTASTTAINTADQAAIDAAAAQSTADGKVKTFYQGSQPASGMSIGDIWVDTSDGNNQYMYTSSGWTDIRDQAIYTEAAAAKDEAVSQAEQDRQEWSDASIYPDQDSIQVKSSNYLSGSSGWAIDAYGNSEFSNGVFRGIVIADQLFATDTLNTCVPLAYYKDQADLPLAGEDELSFDDYSESIGQGTTNWYYWDVPLRTHNDRNYPVNTNTRCIHKKPYHSSSSPTESAWLYYRLGTPHLGTKYASISAISTLTGNVLSTENITVSTTGQISRTVYGTNFIIEGSRGDGSQIRDIMIRIPDGSSFSGEITFRLGLRSGQASGGFTRGRRFGIDNGVSA